MNPFDYNEEELELLAAMENQPLVSVPNLSQEIAQLKTCVNIKHSKRKSINLRVLEDDLQRIKIKAIENGIPYQTLIGSILHKYAHGTL
jgi:predicted DNA binding CopG/RHH family protein